MYETEKKNNQDESDLPRKNPVAEAMGA